MLRLPRNLIKGVRSACAAAAEACRRALVANIFEIGFQGTSWEMKLAMGSRILRAELCGVDSRGWGCNCRGLVLMRWWMELFYQVSPVVGVGVPEGRPSAELQGLKMGWGGSETGRGGC